MSHTIFAGNLRQDHWDKTSSGRPGQSDFIQEMFLWVVADDMFSANGPKGSDQYSPGTGTSGAAAILSGAAAIIRSACPSLTSVDVKKILLESADREIFQTLDYGNEAILTSDPLTRIIQKAHYWSKKEKGTAMDFADNLSKEDPMLAACVVSEGLGFGGINTNLHATEEDIRRIFHILKRTERQPLLNVADLFSFYSSSEKEDIHRLSILEIFYIVNNPVLDERELQKKIEQSRNLLKLKNEEYRYNSLQYWKQWYSKIFGTSDNIETYDESILKKAAEERPNPFKSSLWGKGQLNVKNALIYAGIHAKDQSLSAQQIREQMLKKLLKEQDAAAGKIQRIWRKSKEHLKSLEKQKPLVIDPSIPSTKFEEAEGNHSSNPIREVPLKDRLIEMGQTIRKGGERRIIIMGQSSFNADFGEFKSVRKHTSDAAEEAKVDLLPLPDSFKDAPEEIQNLVQNPSNREANLLKLVTNDIKNLSSTNITEFVEKYRKWLFVPFDGGVLATFGFYFIKNQNITLLEVLAQSFEVVLQSYPYISPIKTNVVELSLALSKQITGELKQEEKKALLSFLYRVKEKIVSYSERSKHMHAFIDEVIRLKLYTESFVAYRADFKYNANGYSTDDIEISSNYKTAFDVAGYGGMSALFDKIPSDERRILIKLAKAEDLHKILLELQEKSPLTPIDQIRHFLKQYREHLTTDQLAEISLCFLLYKEFSEDYVTFFQDIKTIMEEMGLNWNDHVVTRIIQDWAIKAYEKLRGIGL
jgi:hypothetical protein